jgi:hypothetical protein
VDFLMLRLKKNFTVDLSEESTVYQIKSKDLYNFPSGN